MVDAARNGVERFVREKLEAKEWPLGAPIISPQDVLAELPFDMEKHLRNQKTVEAALREIGVKPLTDFGPLRTKTGRKRLWARDGSTVRDIYKTKSRADVIAIYDGAGANRSAVEEQADADEARAEMAGADADEFADLM
jgi:hypothetical protein